MAHMAGKGCEGGGSAATHCPHHPGPHRPLHRLLTHSHCHSHSLIHPCSPTCAHSLNCTLLVLIIPIGLFVCSRTLNDLCSHLPTHWCSLTHAHPLTHSQFLTHSRSLTHSQLQTRSQGKLWSQRKALSQGLVPRDHFIPAYSNRAKGRCCDLHW